MIEKINIDICAFLNFWVWEKKGSRIFFLSNWNTKKIKKFQKILKNTIQGELHKKGTIFHHAPQITLFLLTMYIFVFFL